MMIWGLKAYENLKIVHNLMILSPSWGATHYCLENKLLNFDGVTTFQHYKHFGGV